jgi:hypothetical protein
MRAIAYAAWLFTILTTFAIVIGVPGTLFALLLERGPRARPLRITLAVAAGFIAGGLAAWFAKPFPWDMPFWETAYASVRSDIYGHALESRAEQVLLYVLSFADVGAILSGVSALFAGRLHLRRVHPI